MTEQEIQRKRIKELEKEGYYVIKLIDNLQACCKVSAQGIESLGFDSDIL